AGMNQTQVTEFVLLGFSHGQPLLFALFLAVYLATLLGNSAILSLVSLDPHLRSPMYFFLSHLSCLDLCYSSVTVPKILANALRPRATISYGGCLAQMFFLMWFAGAECALLALMACDRSVAVCRPLHIFCDVPPLLGASCSETRPNELALHVSSIFVGLGPFLLVVISYLYILATILGMPLATSRRKAFSTCSAHLLVVTVYFVTANLNYNRPSSGYSPAADVLVSVLYCIVTPMLNPLIYSLRNREVWGALRRVL
ncbi:OR5V1 protein, partial [Cisticola juncidis]|nr:OR5V1 protein [Cisticola juncidis]